MILTLHLHNATRLKNLPRREDFKRWAKMALTKRSKSAELSVRIVNKAEMAELNKTYRHKSGPTNILSFPFDRPPSVSAKMLGDIVICAPLVIQEAKAQHKLLQAHWAHLVVHGVLHLLGYDHIKKKDAEIMEEIEIDTLTRLGYSNPY